MVVAAAGAPARTRSELVSGLLAQTAEAAPGALAVACGERRMTYAELAAEVDRLAAGLAAAGVGPGDAVALLAAPGTPSLLGFLGILGAGAVAVPMSPASKPAELRFCVEDSGARVVLTDGSLEAAPPPSARVLALDDVLGAGRHAARRCPSRSRRTPTRCSSTPRARPGGPSAFPARTGSSSPSRAASSPRWS